MRHNAADVGINYRRHAAWGEEVRRRAGAVDLVVEVGGSRTLEQSLVCLRNGGQVSLVGFLSGTAPQFDIGEISRKSIRLHGIRVGNRDSFEAMCRAVTQGGIRPVIERAVPVADVVAALAGYRDAGAFGKVCLSFGAWEGGR